MMSFPIGKDVFSYQEPVFQHVTKLKKIALPKLKILLHLSASH